MGRAVDRKRSRFPDLVSLLRLPLASRAGLLRWAGTALPFAFWAFWLRHEAAYDGIDVNDIALHRGLVERLVDSWREGSLGLDAWFDGCCFGFPLLRVYQNLPHALAAAVTFLAGKTSLPLAVHSLICLALAAQGAAFYGASRLMGFSRRTAAAAAWLSPLVAGRPDLMGHQFESYLFSGYGLFTQAIALPALALTLASGARLLGAVEGAGEPRGRAAVGTALWLTLTFLSQHLYGYLAILLLAALGILAALARWISPGGLFRAAATVAGIWGTLSAYQLIGLLQDAPLLHRTPWEPAARWDGHGLGTVLAMAFGGELLDFERVPVFGALAALGLGLAFGGRGCRGHRVLLVPLVLGLGLLSGRAAFGSLVDRIPGMAFLHMERASALVHLAAIFLAALGTERLMGLATGCRGYGRALILSVTAIAFGYLLHERLDYLRFNGDQRDRQRLAGAGLTPDLIAPWKKEFREGYLWTSEPREENLRLGFAEYGVAFSQLGLRQVSILSHTMTYTSDVIPLMRPERSSEARLFNVAMVLSARPQPTVASLTEVGRPLGIPLYRAGGTGMFDVVAVTAARVLPESEPSSHSLALRAYLSSPELERGHYVSLVPQAVAKRWPRSVAAPSPYAPPSAGSVKEWSRIDGGRYRAELSAEGPGLYGVLRVAYHPRWSIRVNGVERFPRWVTPGFLAFPLDAGLNRIEAEFPEDPLRRWLFLGGLAAGLWLAGWAGWRSHRPSAGKS